MSSNVQFVNYTIDDQYGDEVTGRQVEYLPAAGYWAQGNSCDHCAFHPDNASAHDGTWHDARRVPMNDPEPLEFIFKFNGTAVYIYNILIRLVLTDVNITVDGNLLGHYYNKPNMTAQNRYDELIFSNNSLPYGEHTVQVSAFGPEEGLVLFDYALYTTNTTSLSPSSSGLSPSATGISGSSSSNHKTNVGPIVGGVVGGVGGLLLILLAALIWFLRRRNNKSSPKKIPEGAIIPYDGLEKKDDESEILDLRPIKSPISPATRTTAPPLPLSATAVSSYGASASSSTSDVMAVREAIQVLRQHLNNVRERSSISIKPHAPPPSELSYTVPVSPSTTAPTSSIAATALSSPVLQSEISSLRAEIEQLRALQEQKEAANMNDGSGQSSNGDAINQELLREIAILRADVDDLRTAQDLGSGTLPSYSPPPPSHPLAAIYGSQAQAPRSP